MSRALDLLKSPIGAGSLSRALIAAAVERIPLPAGVKAAVKSCPGCQRRAAALDARVPNVNPFAKTIETSQPPTH